MNGCVHLRIGLCRVLGKNSEPKGTFLLNNRGLVLAFKLIHYGNNRKLYGMLVGFVVEPYSFLM